MDVKPKGQTLGRRFEHLVRGYLETTFSVLEHLRPGKWVFNPGIGQSITIFRQYEHLAELEQTVAKNPRLKTTLGHGYLIKPDITIGRTPEADASINVRKNLVGGNAATRTDLRLAVNRQPIMHASISCKWTIRSDRAQNSRSEALNLIRNRKGPNPHVVVVTGEPLPARIAALALGTGDIDCVYHFALDELLQAADEAGVVDGRELLDILVEGRRLKDISDLPLDLAI